MNEQRETHPAHLTHGKVEKTLIESAQKGERNPRERGKVGTTVVNRNTNCSWIDTDFMYVCT